MTTDELKSREARGRQIRRFGRGARVGGAICAVGVLLGAIAWRSAPFGERWIPRWSQDRSFALPTRMSLREVVANLSGLFDPSSVLQEAPGAPVRVGALQPLYKLHMTGGRRGAILAPPPSRLRFQLPVPAATILRFAIGVQQDNTQEPDAAGIRFTVTADGHQAFERVMNPVATPHDRHWFEAEVDLGVEKDRPVELVFRTQAAGDASHVAGTAGWSQIRLVKDEFRERQLASAAAPNVLVLMIDTLRADQVGSYGAQPTRSPTLDRLARNGVVFEEAVSQASWTLPSVASVLTGLHPRTHGVVRLDPSADAWRREDAPAVYRSGELRTMAEYAAAEGITTVGVVSNPLVSRGSGLHSGFETFVELPRDPGRRSDWPGAGDVNDVFLRWLQRNHQYRFLAYLHYMDMHGPYMPAGQDRPDAPDGISGRVARGVVSRAAKKQISGDRPPLTGDELLHLRALYGAQLLSWDREFAGLLDGLSAAGVVESTVIIVTSDHGEQFLEHGLLAHGYQLYDELIRVPLVISGPHVRRGRVREQAQGIDILPTVGALLGLALPPDLPGQNLLASLESRPAFSEYRHIGSERTEGLMVSVRTPEWKLIRGPDPDTQELYHLTDDPGEHDNRYEALGGSSPLVGLLDRWQASTPVPPPASRHALALEEQLRALGYID